MSRKIYNKNLTFLQHQPFPENLLASFPYKKRKAKLFSRRDPFLVRQLSNNNIKSSISADTLSSSLYLAKQGNNNQSTNHSKARVGVSFAFTRIRNKSEKMKRAEVSLIKHFCLILERFSCNKEHKSFYTCDFGQKLGYSSEFQVGNIIPHLLVSIDSMQNTLLATRSYRATERIKPPSHYKRKLRELRKIRLLYGNLSRRQLLRGTSKISLPGENLLTWLESRLDVVLERCGFFGSIKAARQSVLRGNIAVNSKVVKSPGFVLEGGDFIRIVQKELPLNPLVGQFPRGAILSNEVSPRIYRRKNLGIAFSNILQTSKTAFFNHTLPFNRGFNKIVGSKVDSFRARSPHSGEARELSPSKSFTTWLIRRKQRNFQSGEHLTAATKNSLVGSRSKDSSALLGRELQLRRLVARDTIDLDKKLLVPKGWRFRGSPHLLFSLVFFHGYLQKAISSIAHTYNKNVSADKTSVKPFPYKVQKWNNISMRKPVITPYYLNPSSLIVYRTRLNFPTIFFTSKYCGVNTSVTNTGSCFNYIYKGENFSIGTLNIKMFLNCSRQFLQEIKKNGTFVPKIGRTSFSQRDTPTNTRNFLGESLARVFPKLYNNLLPWFSFSNTSQEYFSNQANAGKGSTRLSKEQQNEALLQSESEPKLGAFSQVESGLLGEDEENLLSVLLPDLLLYSLFVKKEIASLRRRVTKQSTQITDQRLDIRLKVKYKDLKKTPHEDLKNAQVRYNFGPILGGFRTLAENPRLRKEGYKEIDLNQHFDIEKRIKPLHLEVSYQSLCAVYLFPPQRVCLPIMVDLDCLAKAL